MPGSIHRAASSPVRRSTRLVVLLLLVAASFSACKKIIPVNIVNAPSQIDINGEVTNQAGPYQIYITQSVNFDANNTFPPLDGARVILRDNTGLYDSLTETTPGYYSTHPTWQGQPGNTYTLTVTTGGATYAASSTMPQPVPLDSVGFQQSGKGRRNTNTVISAIPYFQDPPGIHNYYQFAETINGTPLDEIFIFDDRLSDGKYIGQPARDDSAHLQVGDQLSFSMYCINADAYHYLFELNQVVSGGNGFSSVSPSNPGSNWSNGALGFFSAHTAQTKQLIVHL